MNILFVSDVSIHDIPGGAERVLYEQTTRLAARGHDVHILTRRLPAHHSDDDMIQNVREWRYRVNQNNAISFFASTLPNGRRLFEALSNANKFDCINFHQPFSAFAVMRSASCNNVRKVYTCHSLAFEEYASRNARPSSFIKEIIRSFRIASIQWIEKSVLSRADHVVALSRYTRGKLISKYGIPLNKIAVIPGGVDLVRFHPASDKRAARERLHLPQGKTILLTVRNLVQRMGMENLILAMADTVKSAPDVYLIVGGTGHLKGDLEMTSRRLHLDHHIHFSGYIEETVLPEYYRAADVFVLPTVQLEGFGLVTLEALASGVPVLGTPVGGTQEILSRLDRKFLFPGVSPESISRLIIDFYHKYRNQPDTWRRDSLLCRQFAEKYYSWEMNVEETERLFLESIEH
ncbi:MAG TPA: glycosyltransferase family 4 protein [Syntrophales bacterium]|nr:glycosyltransferase family 4 protein [Syntrophales bacterium]